MAIQHMDHVGIVVDDLAAATAFFLELGLELQGEGQVEGAWVDRVVGLEGVRVEIAMMQTPDGHARLELTKFRAPSGRDGDRHEAANTPGLRHVAFAVEDIDAVVAGLRARGTSSFRSGSAEGCAFRQETPARASGFGRPLPPVYGHPAQSLGELCATRDSDGLSGNSVKMPLP